MFLGGVWKFYPESFPGEGRGDFKTNSEHEEGVSFAKQDDFENGLRSSGCREHETGLGRNRSEVQTGDARDRDGIHESGNNNERNSGESCWANLYRIAGHIGVDPFPFSIKELIFMAEGSTGYSDSKPEAEKMKPSMDDICNALGA